MTVVTMIRVIHYLMTVINSGIMRCCHSVLAQAKATLISSDKYDLI